MGLTQYISLAKIAALTTTTTTAPVSLGGYYVSPGAKSIFAVQSVMNNGSTDAGAVVGRIQCSATTVDTDFSTIATFVSVTDTLDATEQVDMLIKANANYLRHVATVTGAPTLAIACDVFLVKRSS